MMKRLIGVGLVAGTLLACSSETTGTPEGGCTNIAGNYTVTSTRVSGSCDKALDGDGSGSTVTMSKGANGAWDVLFAGIEGGCPGELDPKTCQYIATCKAVNKATGATIVTYNVDYTFAGASLSGSSTLAAFPPNVPTACDVTYKETGKKL